MPSKFPSPYRTAKPKFNPWPEGGRRVVSCLRCGREFRSPTKEVRMCESCRDPETFFLGDFSGFGKKHHAA